MAQNHKAKGTTKFLIWTALSLALLYYAFHSYSTGLMTSWYYYQSSIDGYAVNANALKDATKEKPVSLAVVKSQEINGLQAVAVKKGDRLPKNCNGVISSKDLTDGKRAKLEGEVVKVSVPVQVKEAKGFKFRDTYKHKGVATNPWSGVWNVAVVIGLGFCLGMMAEGFTDMLGIEVKKIKHYEGAH